MPPAGEEHDGEAALTGDLGDELVGGLQFLGRDVELVLGQGGQVADLVANLTHVRGRVGDVTGASLTLGTDHSRALVDAAQRLTEVGRTADERNREVPFVDVVAVVGGGQDLGLVDVVDSQGLQDLCLDEVTDAGLRHDGDRHGVDDALDQVRIGHTCHATLGADVGGDALEGHDGHGTRILGDLRLLGGDDVHDDAALEHLAMPRLTCGVPTSRFAMLSLMVTPALPAGHEPRPRGTCLCRCSARRRSPRGHR